MNNNIDAAIFIEEIRKRINVSDDEIARFLKFWEFRTFKRNEPILRAGSVPKFSIFVLKGCLRQFVVNQEGVESNIYFAEERHFIGDLPALRNKVPSDFDFQAIEACELLTLSAENWDRCFSLFPWWVEAHLKGYQKWATIMQQQMAEMHSKSGEERYLDLLKRRPSLFQRVPQHLIASYLGITAESLSRIRKKLASS